MKPVLLLIDLQNDFLSTPDLQPASGALIRSISQLLNTARHLGIPVVHIWTTVSRGSDERLPHWRESGRWMCEAGTKGHATPDPLLPAAAERVVHKSGFNAFARGTLDAVLRELNCDSLILSGVHLHTCLRIAATEALERQLKVFIPEDCAGSNDPVHAASVRRWLMERTVVFEGGAGICARCAENAVPAAGSNRSALEHFSPIDSTALFQVSTASRGEIAVAVSASAAGWNSWRQVPLQKRAEALDLFAQLLEESAESLAQQIAVEIGKPLSQAREELRRAADNVRDVTRRARELKPVREAAGWIRQEPLGLVALISPWNNPVAIPVGKLAPALVHGNGVVWKPAPAATRISVRVIRLLAEAGVPRDAARIVTGDHNAAQQLATHRDVQAVTFTGSLHGGYALQEICARRVIPLQAELSGNNAAIVWPDADLPEAAAQIVSGAFAFGGQRCTANRRVVVSEEIYESFVGELRSAAERLVLGDPRDERTDIGPLISVAKRDEAEAVIVEANRCAYRVERTHRRVSLEAWFQAGAYIQPAIVCCGEPDALIVQEESMAPVLVVQPASDFTHALQLANGVRHGLIAALFSNVPELQHRFLAEARAGILKLNSATAGMDVRMPFGGWKASHVGPPEHGAGDLLFYTRMQAIYGFEQP